MVIQDFQRNTHSLLSSIYYRAHHGWGWSSFQNRGSQTAGNAMLGMVFKNNKAILLIF